MSKSKAGASLDTTEEVFYLLELDTMEQAELRGPFDDLPSAEDYLRLTAQSEFAEMLRSESKRGETSTHDGDWTGECLIVKAVKRVKVKIDYSVELERTGGAA